MAIRDSSCWRSISARLAVAATASCWQSARSLCAAAKSAAADSENLAIRFALRLQCTQAMTRLCQLCFRRRGPHHQFSAALFVVTAASVSTVDFEGNLADALAVLAQFSVNRVPALRSVGVLGFELLHGFRTLLHLLGESVQLRFQGCTLQFDGGKLAGQHQPQLGAHLLA